MQTKKLIRYLEDKIIENETVADCLKAQNGSEALQGRRKRHAQLYRELLGDILAGKFGVPYRGF
jgi:hypothetical protein